jgi:predicted ATPase/DNA-binding winged helix-turn-helix (wHTH) protein
MLRGQIDRRVSYREMRANDRPMSNPECMFTSFRFNSSSRVLTEGAVPVALGARALAILDALVEAPGRLVPKAELLHRAWPGLNVDEANLKVQVSSLRRVLGNLKILIQAEGSLGYRFVGHIDLDGRLGLPLSGFQLPMSRTTCFPIGRGGVIQGVSDLLRRERLVTILGTGGIGKTTVAREVAHQIADEYSDGTYLVDLGGGAGATAIAAKLLDALQNRTESRSTLAQLLRLLEDRHLLLVLDSAEFATRRVAEVVEQILDATDDIDILLTTREPLSARGERIWRLAPLEIPPASLQATAATIENYASTQLFVRTARAGAVNFQVGDVTAEAIAEVCRELDGIPLAIELAASTVGVLGIDEIRRRLDEQSSLIDLDRRAAIPRQRSMAASIEWSYDRLPQQEKIVLHRLASLTGWFTLDDAVMNATDDKHLDAATVRSAVLALTNKSLLEFDDQAATPAYRMLEMTRAFASRAPTATAPSETPCENQTRLPDSTSYPRDDLYFKDIGVPMTWKLSHEFLLRRLASFQHACKARPARTGFIIGPDRSGRVPLV